MTDGSITKVLPGCQAKNLSTGWGEVKESCEIAVRFLNESNKFVVTIISNNHRNITVFEIDFPLAKAIYVY